MKCQLSHAKTDWHFNTPDIICSKVTLITTLIKYFFADRYYWLMLGFWEMEWRHLVTMLR